MRVLADLARYRIMQKPDGWGWVEWKMGSSWVHVTPEMPVAHCEQWIIDTVAGIRAIT